MNWKSQVVRQAQRGASAGYDVPFSNNDVQNEIEAVILAIMNEYSKTYEIRWSDLDANGHVNYAAYIDAAGDLRYRFFTEHGYPPEKFSELGIGPVYTAIYAQFFREGICSGLCKK